jgi:hypothetical protein
LHQQRSETPVARLADPQLLIDIAGLTVTAMDFLTFPTLTHRPRNLTILSIADLQVASGSDQLFDQTSW